MATAWALLMASACSASTPPGGREAAGSGAGSPPAEAGPVRAESAPVASEPAAPATAGQEPSASQRATPASRPLPPGRFVTHADDGRMLAMQVGESRELRARDASAPDPAVEGDAVQLTEIDNIQAGDGRSWELRAVRTGRSRIVVAGSTPFVVTIDVASR